MIEDPALQTVGPPALPQKPPEEPSALNAWGLAEPPKKLPPKATLTDAFLAGMPIPERLAPPKLPKGSTLADAFLAGQPVEPDLPLTLGQHARALGAGLVGGLAQLPQGIMDISQAAAGVLDPLVSGITGRSQQEVQAARQAGPVARGAEALREGVAGLAPPEARYSRALRIEGGVAQFLGALPSIALIDKAGGIKAVAAAFGGSGAAEAWLRGEQAGKSAAEKWQDALVAGGIDSVTAIAMGPILARAKGGRDAGLWRSLAGEAGGMAGISAGQQAAHNVYEGRPVEEGLGEATAVGALGGGLASAGVSALRGRQTPEQKYRADQRAEFDRRVAVAEQINAAARAPEQPVLREEPPQTLREDLPLTPETQGKGEAYFDPQSQEWRVRAPQEAANVPRGTEVLPEQAAASTSGRAAESLLTANKVEGKTVEAPSVEHTFAEEFARQHGLEVEWVDAGKKLDLPGIYLDRRVALDVHSDPIGLIYHEAVHALHREDPAAADQMLGEIHAADPEGFKKHLGEYESDFQKTTGGEVPAALKTEEGMARYVERLSGYVTAAFTQPERLRALLEHNPGIVRRIVDHAIRLLQKVGVKWKTSQQKALIALRVFARGAGERELKPNRAAELALKIRDSFAAIEGRELPKEETAPGQREQAGVPSQEQPAPSEAREAGEPTAPAPVVEGPLWDPELAVEEQIKSPAAREHLRSLIPGMGQMQRGGQLVYGEGGVRGGQVVGRTAWAPRSEWWNDRPGKMSEKDAKRLVERATSDKPGKFTERQREMLDFLLHQQSAEGRAASQAQLEEVIKSLPPPTQERVELPSEKAQREEAARSEEKIAEREAEGAAPVESSGEEAPFAVRGKDDKLTPEFRKWFGESKVVDEKGEPRVVYHETPGERAESIGEKGFDASKVHARGSDEAMPDGIFLKTSARSIGVGGESEAQIPLFAKIEKPLQVADRAALTKWLERDETYRDAARAMRSHDAEKGREFDKRWDARTGDGEIESHESFMEWSGPFLDAWTAENRRLAAIARARATEIIKAAGFDGLMMNADEGSFGRKIETLVAFAPEQIKSATGNRGTFDPNSPDIRFAVKGDEDIDPLGFYSPLRRALTSERLPAKAPGADWLNIIRKAPGAKRDEIEWSGVEQFLEGKKSVTRQELQEYLRENEVKVEEVARGVDPNAVEVAREAGQPVDISKASQGAAVFPGPSYRLPGGENYRELLLTLPLRPTSEAKVAADALFEKREDLLRRIDSARTDMSVARRELDAVMDSENRWNSSQSFAQQTDHAAMSILRDWPAGDEKLRAARDKFVEARTDYDDLHELYRAADTDFAKANDALRSGQFTAGHWSEPNVLAHMRTTDRVDAQGKNTLFLEEVQSDWHQKGREQGYKGRPEEIAAAKRQLHDAQTAAYDAMKRLDDLGFDNTPQALGHVYQARTDWRTRYDVMDQKADADIIDHWIKTNEKFQALAASKIPLAPFAETWHELAMRRAIRYAAENGYEQVAWTKGIQQVERYRTALRQKIDELHTSAGGERGTVRLVGMKDGRPVIDVNMPLEGSANVHGTNVTLVDLVGREMAEKIKADPSTERKFSGDEIAIGGKGMQVFYDTMVPSAANKIGKQWGVKVGETSIQASKDKGYSVSNYDEIVQTPEGPRHGPMQWGVYAHGADEWLQQGFPTREAAQHWMRENAFQERGPATKVHSLDITPDMRASVLQEGLPRFAVASQQGNQGFDVPDETWSAKFRRAIVNDLDRFEVLERAAPVKAQGDTLETMGRLFPGHTFGETEKLRAQVWKPMKETMRRAKIQPFTSKPSEPSASDFLYGLAALKANETLANEHPRKFGTLLNPGSGMSSVEADRIVQEALKGPKAGAYRELQRLNRSLNARRLDAWVSGQLITPDQRTEMVRRWGLDYVPFRTAEDPAVKLNEVPARPKGFNVTGKEFKKREGRTSKADSPLAFAFDTAEKALDRKQRNLFGLKVAEWAEANNFPDFLRVETDANKIKEGEYKLSFKKNGEQRWLVTKDKALYSAFKRLAPEPGVIRVFDKALQFLHSTIVRWNPAFPFYNFPKDIGTAAVKVGIEHGADWSAAVIKNAPKFARGAWKVLRDENATGKHADLYREARDAGALVGWNQQFDPTARLKDFDKAVNRGAIREGIAKLFDFVDDANRAVELGTRLAVYDKARRSGKSKSEAAVLARKVTADFAQRGTWTPIARRLFLFFGAGVQGTREASMALAKHPFRGSAAFGAAMASGYAFAALSRIFADEDENGGSTYDRMSQYQLAHKGGVMVGNRLYGIPLPWFWNVPYYLGVQAEQMLHGERTAREAVPDVLTAALEAMSPIQGSGPLQALTPTLLRPAEEIATNTDYAGNPIRPPQDPYDKTPTPMSEQAFKDVNPALQAAARALNRWTGGNTIREGAISISPADMEHVIQFVAGGLGSNSWRAMEVGRKVLAGEPVTLPDIPVVRAYVGKPGKSATAQLYYKNLSRVLTAAEEAKAGEASPEAGLGDLKALGTRIEGMVAKLRRARNAAQARGEDAKELEDAMRELQVSFNREVLRATRGSGTQKPLEAVNR